MNYPLRMTHPDHGAMHVYSEADMEKQMKRGWEPEEQEVQEPKKKSRPKKVTA